MEIFAQVEDSVLDITNRCFPDATALAVRLEDLDQTDQEEDFYSRVGSIHQLFIHYFLEKFWNKYKVIIALMGLFSQIMKTPSQTPGLTDYEDSCPTYPTPVGSPSRGGCLLQTPEGKHLNLPCVFILEFQAQVQRRISSGWPWQVTISSVLVFLQILITDGAVSGVVDTTTGDLPRRALAGNHL